MVKSGVEVIAQRRDQFEPVVILKAGIIGHQSECALTQCLTSQAQHTGLW